MGGDLNARIQARKQNDGTVLGAGIFGRGEQYLNEVANDTMDNRDLFINACKNSNLKVANTFVNASSNETVTYRELATPLGAPHQPDKYAVLDFF